MRLNRTDRTGCSRFEGQAKREDLPAEEEGNEWRRRRKNKWEVPALC